MNTEKALQIIKNEIYADGKERAEAMRVIEEAVGKQVAKKPISDDASDTGLVFCPSCQRLYNRYFNFSYCQYCGQKTKERDEK